MRSVQRRRPLALWLLLCALASIGPWIWGSDSVRPVDPASSASRPPGTELLAVTVTASGGDRTLTLLVDEIRPARPAELADSTSPVLRAAPPSSDATTVWLRQKERWLAAEQSSLEIGDQRTFWLGTDRVGRDVLALVMRAARLSLLLGVSAALLATLVGAAVGMVAGAGPRWLDAFLMRTTETLLAFPQLLAVLLLAVLLQPGPALVVLILGLLSWMGIARLVRAETLRLRRADFVTAAIAQGAGPARVLLRHLLPNAVGPALAVAPMLVGDAILVESALAFLGLGASGETPSWGFLVAEGRGDLTTAWWISLFPGLAITSTVLLTQLASPRDPTADPVVRGSGAAQLALDRDATRSSRHSSAEPTS